MRRGTCDAEGGEAGPGRFEGGQRAGFALVGEDLGEGDAEGIVDGEGDVFPAGASDAIAAVAG